MKKFLIFVAVVLIAVAIAGLYKFNFTSSDIYIETPNGEVVPYGQAQKNSGQLVQVVTDFESCVAAGFVVMESYPEQCSDGTHTYTRIIQDNELDTEGVEIANPASVYCLEHAGSLEIMRDESGGEYSVCHFSNGNSCEEWAFFRGECSVEQ